MIGCRSRFVASVSVLAIAFCVGTAPASPAQDEAEQTRGWFIGSRPRTSGPARKAPTGRKSPSRKPKAAAPAASGIGLGYTIFREVPGRSPVRVAPGTVFRASEAVRLLVETNRDGFLYIFVAENGADAVMIYPDARLSSGANFVAAHQPAEVPSSRHPAFQWFRFEGGAATEHIFVVFSTEKLPLVPVGEALVRYSGSSYRLWKPDSSAWEDIVAAAGVPRASFASQSTAETAMTAEEQTATARSMVLSGGAAEPAVVEANRASGSGLFVTRILLRHE